MRRELLAPRPHWRGEMEALGFSYHSIDGVYWDESRAYVFTESEIDTLEAATQELHAMALNAAQHVVGSRRYEEFAIPAFAVPALERSWNAHLENLPTAASLIGRLDLSYDGAGPPKLLEYNADTPTSILEASVAQWNWLQALHPAADQFNSIHEKLIAAWQKLLSAGAEKNIHFAAAAESEEDQGNLQYLRDTAIQAGWSTYALPIERVGLQQRTDGRAVFVDEFNVPIERLLKLYPWEWLINEEFGPALLASPMQVMEPLWKMLLSNKALLVVLWELYPDHPNLLPTYFDAAPLGARYAKKPKLAREGANVLLVDGDRHEASGGAYGAEGFVYQALAPLPRFGEDHTLIGSWLIGSEPAGIGLREDSSAITRDSSRFVPHYFLPDS